MSDAGPAAAATVPAPAGGAGAGAGAGVVEAAAPVKIVVSGASGFIGKATLKHLASKTAPTNITVVTRNPASASAEVRATHAHASSPPPPLPLTSVWWVPLRGSKGVGGGRLRAVA